MKKSLSLLPTVLYCIFSFSKTVNGFYFLNCFYFKAQGVKVNLLIFRAGLYKISY